MDEIYFKWDTIKRHIYYEYQQLLLKLFMERRFVEIQLDCSSEYLYDVLLFCCLRGHLTVCPIVSIRKFLMLMYS